MSIDASTTTSFILAVVINKVVSFCGKICLAATSRVMQKRKYGYNYS